jgi:hypothetical protein
MCLLYVSIYINVHAYTCDMYGAHHRTVFFIATLWVRYAYTHIFVYMSICMYICVFVYMYVYMCGGIYIYESD